ncbi:50S ribosomal protein L3 [Candidatus Woesebacteria bacterium]|nr:50S ribosomal protein L3 [Candidatus Woesebacteria bacterium]
MLTSVFATKIGMTQAWTQSGKRLPVTRCKAELHRVIEVRDERVRDKSTLTPELMIVKQATIGYGEKSLKRLTKPLQGILTKQGFSDGVKRKISVRLGENVDANSVEVGSTISLSSELAVGDIVQVQGTSKGRGYAGVVKRYGFHGGPATHGQSDRERAPGSIGQRTTPGRVFKNHRMAGHMGVQLKTVTGLVVLRLDDKTGEIWLSGPVPGSISSLLKITKMGISKEIELHSAALPVWDTIEQAATTGTTESEKTTEVETVAETPSQPELEDATAVDEATAAVETEKK